MPEDRADGPRMPASPAPTHIVLVGLPGAGKSVCGALLAARLNRVFVDLDYEIEKMAGMSVPAIFAQRGEQYFRDLETEATRALTSRAPAVVAPGGGWIERPANLALVRGSSQLVYLRVSPGLALRRLAAQAAVRPLLAGEDPEGAIAGLFARRALLYETADFTVDTEVLSPEQVVEALRELSLRRGGSLG